MSGDFSGNRQHEFVVNPGSELVGQHHTTGERLAGMQPFGGMLQQVVVREVFYDPSLLDDDRIEELIADLGVDQLTYLKRMPRHSIIGDIVRDGSSAQQTTKIFFPFFPPHLILPIKAGERVWVYQEQSKQADYGWWICRITEPRDIDDLNLTHADRKLDSATKKGEPPTFANGALILDKGQPKSDAVTATLVGSEKEYETIIQDSDSGSLMDFEAVPRYTARPGDHVIQGSNNALISLGTDRISAAAETETKADAKTRKGKRAKGKPKDDAKMAAGTIDIVVGRGQDKSKSKLKKVKNTLKNDEVEKREETENEGDPDFEFDLSRMYVSMKTAVDDNFKIKTKGLKPQLKKGAEGAAVVVKTDHIRFIARKEIRILVQPKGDSPDSDCPTIVLRMDGDIIFIPGDKNVVKIGGEDADKAILCSDQGVAGKDAGQITCPPLVTTMGGIFGAKGAHGTFASKVLVK